MNVLVTGGAGFIGSDFILYCLEKHPEWHIVCLDKLTYAANLDFVNENEKRENLEFAIGDVVDADFVESLFFRYKFSIVVHFAAESHVDRSIEDPSVFYMTNYIGTSVLLECARKHHVDRFHYISTDEVYGDTEIDSTLEFDETSILRPSNPYSASKSAADLLVSAYSRTYSLGVSISRCTNNYGPRQHSEKLIPALIKRASRDEMIPIYGSGRNIREWIYVRDHSRAIDMIINEKSAEGNIYNIGSRARISNLEVACKILDKLGKSRDLISFIPDRLGHDRRYALSSKRIRELGWRGETSFDEGLDKTIAWYLSR